MIKLLVKNRLLGFFSGMMRRGEGKRKRTALFVLLFAVLILSLLFVSVTFSVSLGSVLIPLGAGRIYFALFILSELTLTFVFSIFETRSELFDCKDNDLLMSMPIKSSALLASRVAVVLIINYLTEALVFIPAAVIYAVIARDVIAVIGFAVVSFFVPLLATALACGVGYAVDIIAKKTRGSSVVSVIAYLAFLVAYLYGYSSLVEGMEAFLSSFDPEGVSEEMPVLWFVGGAAFFDPVPFAATLLLSLLVPALAYFLLSRSYLSVLGMTVSTRHAKYKAGSSRIRSPLFALVGKELSRFFSSAAYMLNGALGLIILVIAGIALLVKSSDLEYLAEYVYPLARAQESLSALVGALAGLILSTLLISPSALSLEGSSISVLRSLPINGKTVMLSKLLPSVIISVPSALVFSVLAAIAAGSPIEYLPSVVLTPIAAAVAFSALGLVMNVAFPNFDFQSEAQPIKQSLAVFLTMTLQFVIAIAATGAAVALLYFVGALAASYALLCIYLALSLLFICILLGKCAKKYERISV